MLVELLIFIPAQLLLAAGPLIAPRRNWTILMVTAAGSLLATMTSSLPQWAREKFNCRTNSKETYVLTRGNGHPHIFVIQNGATYYPDPEDKTKKSGISVNLEDLAVAYPATTHSTRMAVFTLALLWVIFLVTVAGLKQDAWYLLGVGSLGTIHNIFVANRRRSPRANGVPLKRFDNQMGPANGLSNDKQRNVQGYVCVEIGHPDTDESLSTMDVLKLAEENYAGLGLLLLKIFFPGDADQHEFEYWKAQRNSLGARRLGLKALLDSNIESLAAPPTRHRPTLFSRTSSSISWRGKPVKIPHRQETDPEKGKDSEKQGTKENVSRKATDNSTSTSTESTDGVATFDFGQRNPGPTTHSIHQSPTSLNPRRSNDSPTTVVTELSEQDATTGAEEYNPSNIPQDVFQNRPLYPVISEQELLEGTEAADNGSDEQSVAAGAVVPRHERIASTQTAILYHYIQSIDTDSTSACSPYSNQLCK